MKMAAIASHKAAPSIFTVAPDGKTNLLMWAGSTLLFSSRQCMVVNRVAALGRREQECLWYDLHLNRTENNLSLPYFPIGTKRKSKL